MKFSDDERATIRKAARAGFAFRVEGRGIVVSDGSKVAWLFPHTTDVWNQIVAFVEDMV